MSGLSAAEAARQAAASWVRPQALLLDAMGTLITLRSSVGSLYADVAARHGLTLEPAAVDAAFASVYRAAPPLAFAGLSGAALEQAERRWWADRIDAVLQAVGQPTATPELHRHLFDHFADPALWRVYEDVPVALERWCARGLRLAVVSNFDSRLSGLLAALDLERWLEVVVISSRAGRAKPDPAPFLQALSALGLGPQQAWHIGDSPEDAEGARAAGLPCLLVQRR